MKRLTLALTLFTTAALLSGCIIVPARHGYYRDGPYRDGYGYRSDAGRYDRGPIVVQPGPR